MTDAERLRELAHLVRDGRLTPNQRTFWAELLFDIATRIQ